MNYVEKTRKLEEHLKDNPKDYQAVVAHLKMRSKAIEQEKSNRMNERKRKVAEYRRLLDERERQ